MKVFLGVNENTLGAIFKSYRIAHNMTQQKVAEYIDVSRSTYAKYESSTRNPDLDSILRLSALYQVSLDDFLKPFFSESETSDGSVAAVSEPKEKNIVEVNENEMRLLLLYRNSMRKSEIIKAAEQIFDADNEIIEEINNI